MANKYDLISGGGSTSSGGSSKYDLIGASGPAPAKSGGGGGGFLSSVEGLVSHAGSDIGSTITGLPRGLEGLANQAIFTFGPRGVTQSLGTAYNDPRSLGGGTVHPFVNQERHIYGSALHGNFHPLYEHPLQPILDLATVATGGGGLAARAGEAGLLGERVGEIANADRVLSVGDKAEALNKAKTLQGRILQQKFDKFSMENPEKAIVGANSRMARITTVRSIRQMARARMPARVFQRVTAPLTKDERIDFYRRELRDSPTPQLRDYVHQLESPGVHEALTNPRPEFTAALHAGKELEEQAGQHLIASGHLTQETREERAVLPQRVMSGTQYLQPATEKIPGFDPFADDRKAMALEARRSETALRQARTRVTQLRERVRIHEGRVARLGEDAPASLVSTANRARAALNRAQQDLLDAQQRRDFVSEGPARLPAATPAQTIKTEGEFVGGRPAEDFIGQPNRVHPDFPEAYRFPHIGEEAGKAGLFTAPSATGALREARTPGFLRHSEGLRLRTARLMTNPEVLTHDFLSTMRHAHLNDVRENVLRPVSKELDTSLDRTGGKTPAEHYFYEHRNTRLPREVREQQALSQDLGVTDERGGETAIGHAANQTVFTDKDMPNEFRNKSIEQLKEMGVRRVPAQFAQKYRSNFAGTGPIMRNFVDKPLDVWRAITLNARPAWMVNNLVGNAAQYALRYAGVDGAAAYLRVLLHTERGEDKVMQLRDFTMKIPTLRRKYGRVFDEVAPELHGSGLYSANVKMTHGGVYAGGTLDRLSASRAARALSLPVKAVWYPIRAVGRGITSFEKHFAEAVPREAAMLREVEPVIQKLGLANASMETALKSLSPRDVELAVDRVNDYMGDFNAVNATERRVLKRIVPFESWYRVIVQVSGKLALHYPGRVNLLHSIAQAYTADDQQLPSWLKGSLFVGGTSKSGVQSLISTQGLNPYETIPQIADQNPASLLNPMLGAGIVGLTNVDPFNGKTYYGPGQGTGFGPGADVKRAAGSFFGGLAPVSTAEKVSGSAPSTLYSPHTYGHLGPIPINDYLLQYLGLPLRHVKKKQAAKDAAAGD